MRIALISLLAVSLVGCGGRTKVVVRTQTVTTSTAVVSTEGSAGSSSATQSTPGVPDCDIAGISAQRGKEGTCRTQGYTVTVVDRGHTACLEELCVAVVGVQRAKTLSAVNTVRAVGMFVLVTLRVTNKISQPVNFWSSVDEQVSLVTANDRTYTPDFDAENGGIRDSFLWLQKAIQPDQAQTGKVVFDVPPSIASNLSAPGTGLVVLNFSDAGKQQFSRYANLRLWK